MTKRCCSSYVCSLLVTLFGYTGASITGEWQWWVTAIGGWAWVSWQLAPLVNELLFPLKKFYPYKPIHTLGAAEIPIGYKAGGEFQTLRFGDDFPHLLVGGQPGSGKTCFLRQVVVNNILTKSPRQLRIHLGDLKAGGIEFAAFEGAEMVEDIFWTIEGALVVLEKLLRLMEARNRMFRQAGVVKIQDYNRKYSHKAVEYHICIIDEFANLEENKEAHLLLKRLLREARSAGIYFILCLQRPDKDTVPGYIKHALAASLCFRVRDEINSRIVLGNDHGEACRIEVPGRGLFLDRALTEVQPMYIPGDYDYIRDLIGAHIRYEVPQEYDLSGVVQ